MLTGKRRDRLPLSTVWSLRPGCTTQPLRSDGGWDSSEERGKMQNRRIRHQTISIKNPASSNCVCFVPSLLTFMINYLATPWQHNELPSLIVLGMLSTIKKENQDREPPNTATPMQSKHNFFIVGFSWFPLDVATLNEAGEGEYHMTCHIYRGSASGKYKTGCQRYFPSSLFTQRAFTSSLLC